MTADPDRHSETIWIGAVLALVVVGFGAWHWMQARSALHAHEAARVHQVIAELSARSARLGQEPAVPGADVEAQRIRLQQLIDQARMAMERGEHESASAVVEAALRELEGVRK